MHLLNFVGSAHQGAITVRVRAPPIPHKPLLQQLVEIRFGVQNVEALGGNFENDFALGFERCNQLRIIRTFCQYLHGKVVDRYGDYGPWVAVTACLHVSWLGG